MKNENRFGKKKMSYPSFPFVVLRAVFHPTDRVSTRATLFFGRKIINVGNDSSSGDEGKSNIKRRKTQPAWVQWKKVTKKERLLCFSPYLVVCNIRIILDYHVGPIVVGEEFLLLRQRNLSEFCRIAQYFFIYHKYFFYLKHKMETGQNR